MLSPFAEKGYIVLTGTSPIDLSATPIFGLTPIDDGADCKIASITHTPVSGNPVAYNGDATHLAGKKLTYGVFYPFPASAITLTSGSAIGWLA